MTEVEKAACMASESTDVASSACEPNNTNLLDERLKKSKFVDFEGHYMDCSFLLGSVSEIERVWPVAKYLMPDNQKSMEPLVFEGLLFFKINGCCSDMNGRISS